MAMTIIKTIMMNNKLDDDNNLTSSIPLNILLHQA